MLIENGFDLAQLDSVATDFHLIVDTAEKFDIAVGEIFRSIGGAV